MINILRIEYLSNLHRYQPPIFIILDRELMKKKNHEIFTGICKINNNDKANKEKLGCNFFKLC